MKKSQYKNKSNKQVINNQLKQNEYTTVDVKQSSEPEVTFLKKIQQWSQMKEKLTSCAIK